MVDTTPGATNEVQILSEDRRHERIKFTSGSRKSSADYTWFRGEHCNYAPTLSGMLRLSGIEDFILNGWLPSEKFISKTTNITAFGSCFAENISKYLASRNFNVLTNKDNSGDEALSYVVRFGEGMVNTYSILQQFEWAYRNKTPDGDFWHGYDSTSFGYDEGVRKETHDIFKKTDVFIITLGLSEVWYDAVTEGVFWRAVPREKYDPSRHKFRIVSTEQNYKNIININNIILENNPDAKIIYTLSPIPLVATFRPVSCITANSASKANLRSAVDMMMTENINTRSIFYWPSYEIVTEGFRDKFMPDRRHIKPPILNYIMGLFEKYYCSTGDLPDTCANQDSLLRRYVQARIDDGTYASRVATALNEDADKLKKIIRSAIKRKNVEYIEPLVRISCEKWPNDPYFSKSLRIVEKKLASGRGLPREKAKINSTTQQNTKEA